MYVLDADDERVVAFVPANRAVLQIPKDKVTSRQFCSPYSRGDIASALLGRAKMEYCRYQENVSYPVDNAGLVPPGSGFDIFQPLP